MVNYFWWDASESRWNHAPKKTAKKLNSPNQNHSGLSRVRKPFQTGHVVPRLARQKSSHLNMTVQHNDLQSDFWHRNLHPPHKIAKFKHDAINSYYYNRQGNVAWNTNTQSYSTILGLFTPNQFYGGAAGTDPNTALDVDIFDMDPSSKVTGSSVYAAQSPLQRYAVLHDISGDVHLMNRTTHPQEAIIYWVTSKCNNVKTPTDDWQQQLLNTLMGISGANVATGTPGAAASPDYYGLHPFETAGFRKNWKLFHKDSLTLQPGSQGKVKFKIGFNKVISEARIRTLMTNTFGGTYANTPVTMPGVTVHAFVVCRGSGIVLKEANENTQMVYSSGAIGWIATCKMNISFVSNEKKAPTQRYYPYVTQKAGAQVDINDVDVATTNIVTI